MCSSLYQSASDLPSGIRAFIKIIAEDIARKMKEKIDFKKMFGMIAEFILPNWIENGFEYPELYGLNPVPKYFTSQLRKSIFTTSKQLLIKIFSF